MINLNKAAFNRSSEHVNLSFLIQYTSQKIIYISFLFNQIKKNQFYMNPLVNVMGNAYFLMVHFILQVKTAFYYYIGHYYVLYASFDMLIYLKYSSNQPFSETSSTIEVSADLTDEPTNDYEVTLCVTTRRTTKCETTSVHLGNFVFFRFSCIIYIQLFLFLYLFLYVFICMFMFCFL